MNVFEKKSNRKTKETSTNPGAYKASNIMHKKQGFKPGKKETIVISERRLWVTGEGGGYPLKPNVQRSTSSKKKQKKTSKREED